MPIRLPWGPNALAPRQPREVIIPSRDRSKIYTEQPSASPVHLSASTVMRSGTTGGVPAAALKNPMGQDMELLEIKFELSGFQDSSAHAIWGGTISAELVMGGHKITNGSIPVWNFSRAENLEGEYKSDTTDNLSFVSYSWRLPRPLFVPAGAVVTPTFSHNGLVPAAINVRVGYSARTVFKKPKVIYLPWVAKYASKAFNPVENAGVDNSTELDLVNSNAEVLHLQRFVGRTLFIGDNGIVFGESRPASVGSQYLKMRMTDSYGRPIVRDFTTFRDVFGALTRSWEMDNGCELDPEAFYKVELRKDVMVISAATGGSLQAFVSMIGWREMGAL